MGRGVPWAFRVGRGAFREWDGLWPALSDCRGLPVHAAVALRLLRSDLLAAISRDTSWPPRLTLP